ncbi:MAG TPA: hypothetical protein VF189_03490 [Patescibacteria group bacterium]
MSKLTIVIVAIVALLVGGFAGYYVERSRAINTLEQTKMAMQKEIDSAKMMLENNPSPTGAMAVEEVMMSKSGVVTDAKGMTLYTYDKDTTSQSTCYSTCAKNWPPYLVSGTAPSTMPAHLGTTKRTDGTVEYTWNNHPLYYYIGDKKAGDTTGDGVGGVWHVAK